MISDCAFISSNNSLSDWMFISDVFELLAKLILDFFGGAGSTSISDSLSLENVWLSTLIPPGMKLASKFLEVSQKLIIH